MARKYHPNRPQNAGDKPVYPLKCRIRAEAGVTRVDIYDDIDADGGLFGGISAKSFAEQLAGVKGALQVNVNSCGGDVWDGLSIFNTIRGHKGPVTTVVDGLAASIASVIIRQAGHERVVQRGAMVMVHDAFGAIIGNESEMAKMAQTLDQVSDNLASVYASRAGGSTQKWRQAMKEESWYTAEEAVAAGLADRVGERSAVLPDQVDLAALGVVPGRIAARLREMPSASPESQVQRFASKVQELWDGEHRAAAPAGQPLRVRGGQTDHGGHELIAPFGIVWQDPDGTTRSLPGTPGAADVPGAKLNGYPWARSLGAFLSAIGDKDDKSGARGVIRKVMEESRPRAAAGLSERIPSEGGYLVPERLADLIASYMTSAIVVPRALPVPLDSLRVPVPLLDAPDQSDGVLGGMTFAMVAEGVTIPATVPEFGVLALEARKAAAYLTSVPNELCDDSPTFSNIFLPRIVANGLAWQEDHLAINGDGIAEPQGLLNAPGALFQVRAASDTVGVADIVAMVKLLHPQSERSGTAVWLLGDDVFGQLLELATLTGSPTAAASAPSVWLEWDAQARFWRLLGIPAFPTEHQPEIGSTGDCILVDLALYLWGTRGEMTVERSQKGAGFGSNTSSFRFRHRIDGRFWPQSTYTLSNGETVSPLVILQVAA